MDDSRRKSADVLDEYQQACHWLKSSRFSVKIFYCHTYALSEKEGSPMNQIALLVKNQKKLQVTQRLRSQLTSVKLIPYYHHEKTREE